MMQGEYHWRNSGCGTEDISGMGFSACLVSHDLPSVVLNKPQSWAAPDSSPCLIRPVSAPDQSLVPGSSQPSPPVVSLVLSDNPAREWVHF